MPRTEWVLKWPGQVVIAGCQTYWTTEVSAALEEGNLPDLYQKMLGQVRRGEGGREGEREDAMGERGRGMGGVFKRERGKEGSWEEEGWGVRRVGCEKGLREEGIYTQPPKLSKGLLLL